VQRDSPVAATVEGWGTPVSPLRGLESFRKASQSFRPGLSYVAPVGATVCRKPRTKSDEKDSPRRCPNHRSAPESRSKRKALTLWPRQERTVQTYA
jgi:hypothetical protein